MIMAMLKKSAAKSLKPGIQPSTLQLKVKCTDHLANYLPQMTDVFKQIIKPMHRLSVGYCKNMGICTTLET